MGLIAAGNVTMAGPPSKSKPARLLQEFALPPFSLQHLGYSSEELAAASLNGLTTSMRPAIGSGLQHLNGNRFLSITDRGPTPDRVDGAKAFPLPQFTPTIVLFKAHQNQIEPLAFLPLVNHLGEPVTGLPNGPADDALGYPSMTSTTPLEPVPDGLDPEEVHTLPNDRFLIVDEYSPSVVIVGECGKVLKRYTPVDKTLPGATYPVSDVLPAVLGQRRANRGFEGIAVSPCGRTAFTVTQSPLGSTGASSPYRDSRLLRILRLDISDPLDLQVTGQFLVFMSSVNDYPPGNFPRDLKVSAVSWVSENRLLFLERTDKPGAGGAKLILVDLTHATDVDGRPEATALPLLLEDVATDLGQWSITPATTAVVLDINQELPMITDFKLEGLAILNGETVAISNDNDFGMLDPDATSRVYKIRLGSRLN